MQNNVCRIPLYLIIVLICSGLYCADLVAGRSSDYYCSFQVVGYYPDYWQIPIPNIRYDKLTRIVFFSIYPNPDGSLNTSQISLTRQANLVATAHSQGAEVSICVGGWNLSGNFSPVTANTAARATFINHLTHYCLDHNFDGVDLDWEPVLAAADRNNYTLLIQELKSALSVHGLTLSVAVFAQGSEFNAAVIEHIDWLHIMAYDMEPDPSLPHSTYEAALAAINHWETFGFGRSKIILGLPLYGRDANWGYHAYKNIISRYAPAPDVDEIAGIYFNGINTIKNKTRYVTQNQYGGVMFWELTGDSENHTSLLTAMTDQIHFDLPPDFDCNDSIDVLDLNYFSASWLRSDCMNSNAWCGASDLDQSNAVNLRDFVIFGQYWMVSP